MKKLAMITSALLAIPAEAATLELLTENNPPLSYAEGTAIKGTATDAVRDLMAKAGVEGKMSVLTWDKAYAQAQSKPNTCVFGTARLPNRQNIFKWYGPIATNTWALYSLPTLDTKKIKKTGDARFFKVGAVKNDAKVDFLRGEGVSSIKEADTDAENPPRLTKPKNDAGYIDLWITTASTAKETAAKAGVKDLKEVLVVRKEPLYLACNPRSDKATLAKLEAAAAGEKKK
jgi:polar amino acid transport system substrate-binding protein